MHIEKMNEVKIVAIAGGSGSGKTFLANAIYEKLGDKKSFVLYQDSYYFDQSDKFDHDGGAVNFDHPNSIDFDLMYEHLKMLKENKPVEIPSYDFATHSRRMTNQKKEPKPLILVDGILILCHPKLREIFDEIVFVSAPESSRFQRRLERDVKERGRTAEGVKNQFEQQVKPMHDQFVEPSQTHANRISSGVEMKDFFETLSFVENLIS